MRRGSIPIRNQRKMEYSNFWESYIFFTCKYSFQCFVYLKFWKGIYIMLPFRRVDFTWVFFRNMILKQDDRYTCRYINCSGDTSIIRMWKIFCSLGIRNNVMVFVQSFHRNITLSKISSFDTHTHKMHKIQTLYFDVQVVVAYSVYVKTITITSMKRHYLYKNYLNFDYYSLITLPHWYTTKIMKKKNKPFTTSLLNISQNHEICQRI